MNRDMLLAWGAVLVCAAIAVIDPAARWRRRRWRPRADVSTAAKPDAGDVVFFELRFPRDQAIKLNQQLGLHSRAPDGRPRARA